MCHEGVVRVLATAAVFGLPIALTLAWMFDVSAAANTAGRRVLPVVFGEWD